MDNKGNIGSTVKLLIEALREEMELRFRARVAANPTNGR